MSKETNKTNTNEVLDIDLELFDEENDYSLKGKAFGNKVAIKAKKEVAKGIVKEIAKIVKDVMK